MSREIKKDVVSIEALQSGVNQLADAVKVTLGSKGRNVIIQSDYAIPHVTKDGVTVARSIELPDPVENMGAELLKEAASKAANETGDGTTTTTVLAQGIINRGVELMTDTDKHYNPIDLKRGIDKCLADIKEGLANLAEPIKGNIDKVRQIATISANGDIEVGSLIAEAMDKVNMDGILKVEESKTSDTTIDIVDGMQFINGLLSPYFITNAEKISCELEEPNILFYGKKVVSTKEILKPIEIALSTGKPFVIVANDYEGEVIETLVQNVRQKGFKICAVKAPSTGDNRINLLEDMALLTGGAVMGGDRGESLDNFTEDSFGSCAKFIADRERTTIMDGVGDKEAVKEQIEVLRKQIENSKQEFDDDLIRNRISKLAGGVGVIYVGAYTETEMKEKKDRVDDALGATRAAVEEGIIAGGGATLLHLSKGAVIGVHNNEGERKGYQILVDALSDPLNQIILNSGEDRAEMVIAEMLSMDYPSGYDADTGKYVDMLEVGIIDPVKVTRVALEGAASIASMILTTGATISKLKV